MDLNEENFLLYAAKHYDLQQAACTEEFYNDIKRFQYLKRLFKRYKDNGDLKVRLILNHIVVLYNCFGPEATPMLFMRLKDHHECLKPFVLFLSFLPKYIYYGDEIINSNQIFMDETIVNELRKLQ